MENRLRQRLVGAAVLIALAVLLLPLWLDGEGLRHTLDVAEIPERPQIPEVEIAGVPEPMPDAVSMIEDPPERLPSVTEDSIGTPVDEPPGPPAGVSDDPQGQTPVLAEDAAEALQGPATSGDRDEDASGTAEPETRQQAGREPDESARSPAEDEDDAPGAVARDRTGQAPAPSESPASTEAEGSWVVQLGSFSDELNARGLRESVQETGFRAYVEPLFAEQGTVWRVRVGPFRTREEADIQRARLRERLNRDGMVVRD